MTDRNLQPKCTRRGGFTLVEMLTVIVIIGILAALVLGASIAVRNRVRVSMIVSEIKQMEIALQNYKNEVGEFPPDFAFIERTDALGDDARARVVRHLRKAWPRMRLNGTDTETQFDSFLQDKLGITRATMGTYLNPSTALTLWLGGMPDPVDGKPKGFHSDPAEPFKQGEPRSKAYFDFDLNRLDGLQFFPARIQPATPYVYFRAVKNNSTGFFEYGGVDASGAFTPYSAGSGDNICVPYLEDAYDEVPTQLVNPSDPQRPARTWRGGETYQILSAGLDGVYSTADGTPPVLPGVFRVSKLGIGFSAGDYDNLASFAEGKLEDEL